MITLRKKTKRWNYDDVKILISTGSSNPMNKSWDTPVLDVERTCALCVSACCAAIVSSLLESYSIDIIITHTMCWNTLTHRHMGTRTSMYSLMAICCFWFSKRREKREMICDWISLEPFISISNRITRCIFSYSKHDWWMHFEIYKLQKKISQKKKRINQSSEWVRACVRERDRISANNRGSMPNSIKLI